MIARQLASEGGMTVATQMYRFQSFTARPESSYQAHLDDGYATLHGTAVQVDTTGMTVLEPRATLHDACEYLANEFVPERGIVYVLMCADGHKIQLRLTSVQEELGIRRALDQLHRDQVTRTVEP